MRDAPARPARLVLDANVLVSAAIAAGRPSGSTLGRAVDRALAGDTTVITCPRLLTEVEWVLRSPRLARWVDPEEVDGVMRWIVGGSTIAADPEAILLVCRDPADDYVVALARREAATIVTGDGDLLALRSLGVDVITVAELAARFWDGL